MPGGMYEIYLILIFINNFSLGLFDDFENIGLFVIISVSTDTQIYFLWVGVFLVGGSCAENWIRRSKSKMTENITAFTVSLVLVNLEESPHE